MSVKQKTAVIFGVSSFVGSNLAEYLKKEYRVIGTYHDTRVQIPGVLTLPCDVLKRDSVQMVLYTFRPDITIYAVGLSSVIDCAAHQKFADTLNTSGLFNVTNFSERYKSKLIYLSSAYIFSGEDKVFHENDTPGPSTILGKTKASAEFFIQKSCLNYLIFRCCLFYGQSLNPRQTTFFERIQEKMAEGKAIPCDSKVYNGYLDVSLLGKYISKTIESGATNRLLHITSKNVMSPYEFARAYAKVFGASEHLVTKKPWSFPEMENALDTRTGDDIYYKLDTLNLESTIGSPAPTIEESLQLTFRRLGGEIAKAGTKGKGSEISYI